MNVNDIEVKFRSNTLTIGEMIERLEAGHATYWHWHTLLNMFEKLYSENRNSAPYKILLPKYPTIDDVSFWGVEAAISQGSYNKQTLLVLRDMYGFLLSEQREGGLKLKSNGLPTKSQKA